MVPSLSINEMQTESHTTSKCFVYTLLLSQPSHQCCCNSVEPKLLVWTGVNMICHHKLIDKAAIFDLDWRSKMLEHTRGVPQCAVLNNIRGWNPWAEACPRDCPKPLPLKTQSTEHYKHWEGLSRALRWLEEGREEEQRNKSRWELKIDGMRS